MNRKRLLVLIALAMATICGPVLAGDPSADVKPSPDVAWLVIGIQPVHARMEIDEPWMRKGVIWNFHYNLTAYHPVDGFILVKAKPGALYGVAASSLMWGKSIFGVRYKPCGQVPTFQAAGGKVVYFTSIAYRGAGVGGYGPFLDMRESAAYGQDLEGARAFLKAHYPGLADSVEQGSYEMMPMARRCG